MMRLQKFIADSGITSRRKAEQLMSDGKIKVNGVIITKLGTVIDELNDIIEYAGRQITIKSHKIYLALNKPIGYVSSTVSTQGQSVLTLVNVKERVYPVGRLDKDSSGLLILTNDGELANKISHPRNGSEKEYFAVLDQDLRPDDAKRLERGMIIDGKRLQPVKVSISKNKSIRLILKEGINRQIRRQLGKLGYTVIKLKRIRIGKLELGNLPEGKWREIKVTEL